MIPLGKQGRLASTVPFLGELASPYIWHRDPKSLSATKAPLCICLVSLNLEGAACTTCVMYICLVPPILETSLSSVFVIYTLYGSGIEAEV